MRAAIILTALVLGGAAHAADKALAYRLDGDELAMAGVFGAASTAATVCRESDGVYLNKAFMANWQAQYAVADAGRDKAFASAVRRARAGVMAQVNQEGADGWCDDYLTAIADTYTPTTTPVFFDDPLGFFQGPLSQSAVDVLEFFGD